MVTKNALVRQVQGATLIAKGDTNHWVVMDGSPSTGGSDAATKPKELLLMALGGCTGMDVITILEKKRVNLEGLEIHLTGTEQEEHPKIFTEIHVEYVVFGKDIKPADVERAIELSTSKYCSVSAMLKPTVSIRHSYRIESGRRQGAATREAEIPQQAHS